MYLCMYVRFQHPSQADGFWKHTYIRSWRLAGKVKNARNPHRERGLGSDQRELCCRWDAKTLTGRGVSKRTRNEYSWSLSMYVCMYVCLGTYIHASKCVASAKTITGRGVLSQLCKKPSQREGFWTAWGLNTVSLWEVSQNPSPFDGFCSLKCSDLDFKKNVEFLHTEA